MAVGSASAQDYVAMLLPENVNLRWESQDARFFLQRMAEIAPDVEVVIFNANNDTAAQHLTRGAKVLVVVPVDGDAAAIIADIAEEAGMPAIADDRMIHSENTDFWVQASMERTGEAQAQHEPNRGVTVVHLDPIVRPRAATAEADP